MTTAGFSDVLKEPEIKGLAPRLQGKSSISEEIRTCSHLLRECPFGDNPVKKLSSLAQLQDEVDICCILKYADQLCHIFMLANKPQDLHLPLDVAHVLLYEMQMFRHTSVCKSSIKICRFIYCMNKAATFGVKVLQTYLADKLCFCYRFAGVRFRRLLVLSRVDDSKGSLS